MPCRDGPDESELHSDRIKEQEIALCKARTALYKLHNWVKDKIIIDGQIGNVVLQELALHKKHRLKDKKREVEKLKEIIKNTSSSMKVLDESSKMYNDLNQRKEGAEKKLNKIISYSDDEILDRDLF